MAAATQIPIEIYLAGGLPEYEPDVEFIDGVIEHRNVEDGTIRPGNRPSNSGS